MKKFVLVLVTVLLLVLALVVLFIPPNPPDSYSDRTPILLDVQINTIPDAYEFSVNRINEWGVKAAKLQRIEVFFEESQIESQRGTIAYIFFADNGQDNYLAEITVTLDMEISTSTSFDVWYDSRTSSKRNKDGGLEGWSTIEALDMSQWTLTLDELFAIVYEYSPNVFSRYENPEVSLSCASDCWTLAVNEKGSPALKYGAGKHYIYINPVTKELMY